MIQIVRQVDKATCLSPKHARTVVWVQEIWGVVACGGVPTIAAVPQLLGLLNGFCKALLELLQTGETRPENKVLGRLQRPICC